MMNMMMKRAQAPNPNTTSSEKEAKREEIMKNSLANS